MLLAAALLLAQTACDPAPTPSVAPATTPRDDELPATPPARAPTLASTPGVERPGPSPATPTPLAVSAWRLYEDR